MAPTCSVTYNPATNTNTDVLATLTGCSESITVTNNGGSTGYTFTNDGTFTFNFIDHVGNTGSTTANVNRIDKTPVIGTITYSTTGHTNCDVTATVSFNKVGVTITNNGGSANYVFTGNGSFTFNFIDAYGNTGTATATVTTIDKTPPVCGVRTPSDGVFTGTLHFTLTGSTDGESGIATGGGSCTVSTVGTNCTLTISDNVGNTTICTSPSASCGSGYTEVAGVCVPTSQTKPCPITNGSGTQASTDGGVTWGTCTVVSCDPNYHTEDTLTCTDDTKTCTITNGSGSQTWNGTSRGTCTVTSCASGYTQVGNTCELINQTKPCSITNGSGSQASTDGGVTRGTCTVVACDTNYHTEDTLTCTDDTKPCPISNGSGSQTWNGTSRGTCTVTSCGSGYTQVGNTCEPTNQTKPCPITNGS